MKLSIIDTESAIGKATLSSLTLSSLLLLSACGAGSGGAGSDNESSNETPTPNEASTPIQPVPDQVDPNIPDQNFNYIAAIKENQAVTAPLTSLSTDLNDPAYVIQLQSNGFPNRIDSMTTADGAQITDKADIEKLFVLFINPESGEVEIQVNKTFDFEAGEESYQLAITLGTESINVLVNIYDVQTGSAGEPLKISSYGELKSFFKGEFISENIGNDVIELDNPNSGSHNIDDFFIQLDRDIDASASADSPWTGYELGGQLDGKSFVINNLSLANGKSFIANENKPGSEAAKVKNIGFVDTQLTATFIRSSAYASELSNVFLSGTMKSTHSSTVYFSPFSVAGEFTKVYTNIFYDLSSITTTATNGRS